VPLDPLGGGEIHFWLDFSAWPVLGNRTPAVLQPFTRSTPLTQMLENSGPACTRPTRWRRILGNINCLMALGQTAWAPFFCLTVVHEKHPLPCLNNRDFQACLPALGILESQTCASSSPHTTDCFQGRSWQEFGGWQNRKQGNTTSIGAGCALPAPCFYANAGYFACQERNLLRSVSAGTHPSGILPCRVRPV
jgi:hypothetical protein